MVKVSSLSSKLLGVVDTWWQLKDVLDKAFHAADRVRVEESECKLPTMLITVKVMEKVHEAIQDHRLSGKPISKCMRAKTMDCHMVGSMNVSVHGRSQTTLTLHRVLILNKSRLFESFSALLMVLLSYSTRRTIRYSAAKHRHSSSSADLTPSLALVPFAQKVDVDDIHRYARYDQGRDKDSPRNERRLILSAECQVGKTGAYLHFLELLMSAASTIPVPSTVTLSTKESSRGNVGWLLPYWGKLSGMPPLRKTYHALFASKYTAGVIKKRAYLVVQSCKREGWVANFQRLLLNVYCGIKVDDFDSIKVYGETVTSQAGKDRITTLKGKLPVDAPFDMRGQPIRTVASSVS